MMKWPVTSTTLPRPDGRRRLLAVAGLLLIGLAGCSSDGESDWAALWSATVKSFSDRESSVSLEQASAIPYATMGVRIGEGPQQLLILAMDNSSDRLWTSAARVSIETRNGRVIRTVGFPSDLSGHVDQSDQSTSWSTPHSFMWKADLADLGSYSISVLCRDAPATLETIAILGKSLTVRRVEEDCEARQIGWTFQNTYWVDPQTGRVWRSIQNTHPGSAPLELEILRPPASPG